MIDRPSGRFDKSTLVPNWKRFFPCFAYLVLNREHPALNQISIALNREYFYYSVEYNTRSSMVILSGVESLFLLFSDIRPLFDFEKDRVLNHSETVTAAD